MKSKAIFVRFINVKSIRILTAGGIRGAGITRLADVTGISLPSHRGVIDNDDADCIFQASRLLFPVKNRLIDTRCVYVHERFAKSVSLYFSMTASERSYLRNELWHPISSTYRKRDKTNAADIHIIVPALFLDGAGRYGATFKRASDLYSDK